MGAPLNEQQFILRESANKNHEIIYEYVISHKNEQYGDYGNGVQLKNAGLTNQISNMVYKTGSNSLLEKSYL